MNCRKCGKEYHQRHKIHYYCDKRNAELWKEWEIEEADNLEQIKHLQKQGHSQHCACRQVWGDGECECELYKHGYDPYGWMKGKPLKETIEDIDKAYKAVEEKQK